MDQPQDQERMATWFGEEGLAPDSPTEVRLCVLWRALQHTRCLLSTVKLDLDNQRSQHLAEMADVRKSLEQIRIFTEHKDVLAQEIQDENDQLNDQLQHVISLQDAQISEVAKMLYQQGLTELIHSSPSEQVAYLLVERTSFLETSDDGNNLSADGNTASPLVAGAQAVNTNAHQSLHKGAPRHSQNPWKRLFGHKSTQSKHTFIPAEPRLTAGQAISADRACSRLERDLEEGSRRLAMAHNEIRRLTDELESAHLTQRAYEPELQAAEQEVEQLRQEVEKLKKFEMVELRKAKDLNDRLDVEIRALRSRVRSLDAEKGSLQQTVVSLQKEVGRRQQQTDRQLHAVQVQANELANCEVTELTQSKQTCRHLMEELTAQARFLERKEEIVVSLQKEVERLELALQERQQQQANEFDKSQAIELIQTQSNEVCRELENKLNTQSGCLLEKDSEIHALKQQLDHFHKDLNNLIAIICSKRNNVPEKRLWKQKDAQHCENAHCQLQDSFETGDKEPLTQLLHNKKNTLCKECPDYQEAVKTLLATQDECETLKKEICEILICLDKERSKNHEIKEKHKAKLCRSKLKFDEETTWRDDRLKDLERELSLCSHSLAKEKEVTISITVQNDELLSERRKLLRQLNEEEHIKKDSGLTSSLSKQRVDFREMENKKLGNKILPMSNQLTVLERSQQDKQSLHFAEELKKIYNPTQVSSTLRMETSSVKMSEPSEIQGFLDNTQPDMTSNPHFFIVGPLSRSAENGYLNLTSTQTTQSPPSRPQQLR